MNVINCCKMCKMFVLPYIFDAVNGFMWSALLKCVLHIVCTHVWAKTTSAMGTARVTSESLRHSADVSTFPPPLQCKGWHFFPPDCCTLFSHRGIYMCARNMQQKRLTKAQTASTPDHCNISGFIKAENIKLIYCIFEYSHIFLTSSAALRTVHYQQNLMVNGGGC